MGIEKRVRAATPTRDEMDGALYEVERVVEPYGYAYQPLREKVPRYLDILCDTRALHAPDQDDTKDVDKSLRRRRFLHASICAGRLDILQHMRGMVCELVDTPEGTERACAMFEHATDVFLRACELSPDELLVFVKAEGEYAIIADVNYEVLRDAAGAAIGFKMTMIE
jgi:hypothetical protein